MSYAPKAVWAKRVNGKSVYICGSWSYNWAADRFNVRLIQSEHTIGIRNHDFQISDDHPEWNDWKLVKDQKKAIKIYDKMNPPKQQT